MEDQNLPDRQLESWKEIAAYLKTSVRTAQRWEEQSSLPVTRVMREKRSAVYANTRELDRWLKQRSVVPDEPETVRGKNRWNKQWGLVFLLGSGLLVLAFGWRFSFSSPGAPAIPILRAQRLTSMPGIETQPVLSPDGRNLAFVFHQDGIYGVAIQNSEDSEARRIFESPFVTLSPQWAPDGHRLALLVNGNEDSSKVVVVDVTANRQETVGESIGYNWFDAGVHAHPAVQWTPDGKALLLADGSHGVASMLVRFDIETKVKTPIYTAAIGRRIRGFALSPNARQLALVLQIGNQFQLHTLPLGADLLPTGLPQPVLADSSGTESPAWSPEGDLYFVRNQSQLWRLQEGKARELHVSGPLPDYSVSASADGRVLWSHIDMDTAIAEYDPKRKVYLNTLCDSSTLERQPRISPDGKQLLFNSVRDGVMNLWVCSVDGKDLRRITNEVTSGLWDGVWSPDGTMVAYALNQDKKSEIRVVRTVDSSPVATIRSSGTKYSPTWSSGNDKLYFLENDKNGAVINRYELAAKRCDLQMALPGASQILEALDGKIWVRSQDKLSLLQLSPNMEQKVVATRVGQLVAVTRDGTGVFVVRSETGSSLGSAEFLQIDEAGATKRIAGPLTDAMGYGPGPGGLVYVVRNTAKNSDIYVAKLNAK